MVLFLKQCYKLYLDSKPTCVSAILLYNWVLLIPNLCGWFSDFLVLDCFSISTSSLGDCFLSALGVTEAKDQHPSALINP